MRCHRMVVVASLFAAGSQAYAPIQTATGPAKGIVVLPKGFPENMRGTVKPQMLSVGDPTASDSPSMTPYFTAKLDQTISWDDMDWCLEATGDKSGDAVRVNQCTGKACQKWRWIPDGHGSNKIQLQNTNMCMDVDAKQAGPNGAPIELRDCGKEVTAWKFEDVFPLPTDSADDSLSYEARHVLITLMTLAGLGVASAGAWLWQKGGITHRGSDQEMVPSVMLVNPMQTPFQTRATRAAKLVPRSVATMSDVDRPPSLLSLAGQAKGSGVLCLASIISAALADTTDTSALEAVLRFPPGGPVMLAVATVSGLYTLWKIQPVLAAVQATVDREDAARAQRRANGNDSDGK